MLSPSALASPPPALPSLQGLAAQGRVWRAHSLGKSTAPVLPSSFAALDAELPGGGWPLQAVTELLTPQAGVLEWRLLAPALHAWWAAQAVPAPAQRPRGQRGRAEPARRTTLLLINPPHTPHLPGLQGLGLPTQALIWVTTATPAQALWTAEQALKSRVAVLAWLPEARPEQVRRLQVHAQSSDAPAFLVRPAHASQQPSAAPLRLAVRPGDGSGSGSGGWALDVHLLKRRGPAHEGWLSLPAVPDAVASLLTAGWRLPSTADVPDDMPTMPPAAPTPNSAPPPSPTERPHALARPVLPA